MAQVDPEGLGVVGREGELAAVEELAHAAGAQRARPRRWARHREDDALGSRASRPPARRVARALRASERRGGEPRVRGADRPVRRRRTDELAALPAPQRHALEVALLRATPTGAAPEARAIGVGLLNALRALAASTPAGRRRGRPPVARPPSSEALAYAARRLEGHDVRFLLAQRSGGQTAARAARSSRAGSARLELGPLSLGSLRGVCWPSAWGSTLPRQLVRRIHDVTLGNPLFALEVGRKLAEEGRRRRRGAARAGRGRGPARDARRRLPPAVRRLLLAVALSSRRARRSARRVGGAGRAGATRSRRACSSSTTRASGRRTRCSPRRRSARRPRASVASCIALSQRRPRDGEVRTRHLALAASEPDAALATTVASAAATPPRAAPSRRPPSSQSTPCVSRRRTTPSATSALLELGAVPRARGREAARHRPSRARARVDAGRCARARAYLSCSPAARSAATTTSSGISSGAGRERGRRRARARRCWRRLPRTSPRSGSSGSRRRSRGRSRRSRRPRRRAGGRAARALRARVDADARAAGRSTTCASGSAPPRRPPPISRSRPSGSRVSGSSGAASSARHAGTDPAARRGRRARRAVLVRDAAAPRLRARASRRRLGRCRAPARRVGRFLRPRAAPLADVRAVPRAARRRSGPARRGRRWGVEAIARARASGVALGRVRGAAGASGSPRCWRRGTRRRGRAVRASSGITRNARASRIRGLPGRTGARRGARRARRAGGGARPSRTGFAALRGSRRTRGGSRPRSDARAVVGLALRYDEAHVDGARASADAAYWRSGCRFDAARSLLSLGRAQRRARKWGAARQTLERATSAFDALGSPGWAETARGELARAGARRPAKPGA